MYKRNYFLLIFSLLWSAQAFSKDFNVAALYWSSKIEGQVAMKFGIEQRVAALNKKASDQKIILHPFIAGDGIEGVKNQVAQFNKVIKEHKKYDLVIIQPTDNAVLSPALIMANEVKLPVVAYDQYIVDGELASFITSNNYQAGVLNAEYVAHQFKNSEEIKIVLAEYPKVSSTVERVDGFFNTLKHLGQKYKVIKAYEAVEPVAGKKVGQQIIKDFPEKGSVDVVFSINDGGGISIAKELIAANRNEIIHVTVDGDPESVKIIKNKKVIKVDSAQFCAEMGRQVAQVAWDYLAGKKYPKKVLVPVFPITIKTMKHYSGWKGRLPGKVTLPWNKRVWSGKVERVY